MPKAPFQFGMKALFASLSCAVSMLTAAAAMTENTTLFGTFVGAMALCAIAALATELVVCTVLYLVGWIAVVVFEPQSRRPSPFRFRVAAVMLSATAVLVAAFSMFAVLAID